VISEAEQERQLSRLMTALQLSGDAVNPGLPDGVTQQCLMGHPEQPLLAYVLGQSNSWLQQIAARGSEAESDKHVLMACINFVNCIAYTQAKERRA
jgi:hypothetical protein